jgi:hypothetical protein
VTEQAGRAWRRCGAWAAALGALLVAMRAALVRPHTAAAARQLVAGVAGAVALVPTAAADGGVRVLRVDGRGPGDAGYRLAEP